MLVDLQVSNTGKDGAGVEPDAFVASLKTAGLDGAVITGADGQFADLSELKKAAEARDVVLFAGARIPTHHGLLLAVLPDPIAAWSPGEGGLYDAEQVIQAVEEKGGVTVALRPYDRDVPRPMGDHIFTLQGLAACEVQSGRLQPSANELALEAASNLELPCVGSSAAQGTDGLGTAATLFRSALKSEADLIEAIRHGDCWPVTFSTAVPVARPAQQSRGGGRDRRDDGDDRGGRRGRGGRRRRGGQGGGPREGAPREGGEGRPAFGGEGRGGLGGGEGRGEGGRSGGGARRGRSRRGGRGGGPVSDDIGNRVSGRSRAPLDENFGNVRRDDTGDHVDENIGNRLRPGEAPLFKRPVIQDIEEEDEDTTGNR